MKKKYKKLPGKKRGLGGTQTLWAGPDHLLLVRSMAYEEQYQRFFYSDIQAIAMHKTRRGLLEKLLTGLAVVGAGLALNQADPLGRPFWGVAAAVAVFLFLYFLVTGRTYKCRLQTAAQKVELPSLNREWRIKRALARIRPLVEKAQGRMESGNNQSPESAPGWFSAPEAERASGSGGSGPVDFT